MTYYLGRDVRPATLGAWGIRFAVEIEGEDLRVLDAPAVAERRLLAGRSLAIRVVRSNRRDWPVALETMIGIGDAASTAGGRAS